ncbi:hypothetical protein HYC85_020995 [Camellia sinensis]|uniref:Uncharacterized protein n=1 Tax=Camellia sinensis TaxID=4442 RepID=A0A7J7GKB5_CAMSI|nr:hypothetical protein HYC85_020995 [Camellia sinensis]
MIIGSNVGGGLSKKRQRVGSNNRLSSTTAVIDSSRPNGTLTDSSRKRPSLRRSNSHSLLPPPPPPPPPLVAASTTPPPLTSSSASISNSHRHSTPPSIPSNKPIFRSTYTPMSFADRSISLHCYRIDGRESAAIRIPRALGKSISSIWIAFRRLSRYFPWLSFEDCVRSCFRFLEAVSWTEEEEKMILSFVPFLRDEESKELLARVSPAKNDASEEMLHGLILTAIHNHPNMAFAKAFVAKLLRQFSSRESARIVLDLAFQTSLKIVKESLEEYSSPAFRGDHNETEPIQRLNLRFAMSNGKHLLWLIERMIELRVADIAVKDGSEQDSFPADLRRAFRDDAWRNIVPGLPAVVL